MTLWQPILLAGLLAIPAVPQAVDAEKWNTVGRMCGKLEWVEEVSAKGSDTESTERSKPIKKANIRLYRRNNESNCCGPGLPIAKAVTKKNGEFELNNSVPGSYRVLLAVNGKQYSRAIKYAPDKAEAKCSDLLDDIKKGELELRRVIHVD